MNRKEIFRFIFWEWIEPIGTALCIALLVMKFVMAIYVIPTGSMQPTLHGKGDYPSELGDKVLVNKFIYKLTKPKKWDVIVFVYPYNIIQCSECGLDLDRMMPRNEPKVFPESVTCPQHGKKYLKFIEKDYIKRCVAVGGDELTVRDGNILLKRDGKWTFSEKTTHAQAELWRDIFSIKNEKQLQKSNRFWKWGTAVEGEWDTTTKQIFLSQNKAYSLKFFNKDLLRGFGDKGIHPRRIRHIDDRPLVGDVKLDVSLENNPQKGILELELLWNMKPYKAQINFEEQQANISVFGKTLLNIKLNKESKSFSFARLDGSLYFYQNEKETHRLAIPDLNPQEKTYSIQPTIRYKGDSIHIVDLSVKRDIFYGLGDDRAFFKGKDASYKVLPGEYFAMGDNSFYSSDSRYWGPVPEDVLIGKALAVLWPYYRVKLIY